MVEIQSYIDDLKALITELEGQSRVLNRIWAGLDPVRDVDMRSVLTYRIEILIGEIDDLRVKLNELTGDIEINSEYVGVQAGSQPAKID